jgi:hypothetical protein
MILGESYPAKTRHISGDASHCLGMKGNWHYGYSQFEQQGVA